MTNQIYLFPGQGSQKKGMLADLYETFPIIKQTFAEASKTLGFSMEELCFEDPENQLNLTAYTQPALLTCSTAIWRLLESENCIQPTSKGIVVAGHSLGEYSALVALGVLDFSDALRLVRLRGQAMQEAVPVGVGSMAALVGEAVSHAEKLCLDASTPTDFVEIANENSLAQVVVSGHSQAVDRLCHMVKENKWGKAIVLPVSAPFHSSLMKPAADRMEKALQDVQLNPNSTLIRKHPGCIVANTDAAFYSSSGYQSELLVKQIFSRVKWTQTLLNISTSLGHELSFVEVGPGSVLQGLVRKTLTPSEHLQYTCHSTENTQTFQKFQEHLTL